jgi:hypothetical protein
MSHETALGKVKGFVQTLETADLIRDTFPLMMNLQQALRSLRSNLPADDAGREEVGDLMDRLHSSLLQGIPEQFLIRGIEQERDAIKAQLNRG